MAWTQEQQDARDARALVTGTLLALLGQYAQNPDKAVLIDKVDMVTDERGDHQSMARLHMRSGVKLLVIVAEDV